jgi:hypothetical protein
MNVMEYLVLTARVPSGHHTAFVDGESALWPPRPRPAAKVIPQHANTPFHFGQLSAGSDQEHL